ncbi:MAG: hypothetical protein V4561_01335 [Bacteroidota bacterium]
MQKRIIILVSILILLLPNNIFAQGFNVDFQKKFVMPDEFLTLRSSEDSTYGYIPANPIKIGTGDSLSTQIRMYDLMFCLRTEEGQVLLLESLDKITTEDQIEIDAITLSIALTSKRIKLYFDTKNKSEIFCPKGLVIDTLAGTYSVPYIRNERVIRRIQE